LGFVFALLEPEALAIHLKDVDVMGEAVEECVDAAISGPQQFLEGKGRGLVRVPGQGIMQDRINSIFTVTRPRPRS
jgi:hypothetical protein